VSYALIKSQRKNVNTEKGEWRGVEVNLNNMAEVKMKKLALIVFIAAFSTFISVAVASAGDKNQRGFHGEYAMTGSGNCIYSLNGFTVRNIPNDPIAVNTTWGAYFVLEGIWTFLPNQKGVFQGMQYGMAVLPYPTPNSTTVELYFEFTYEIDHDGSISGDIVPATFKGSYTTGPSYLDPAGVPFDPPKAYNVDKFSFTGWISQDHKTITLTTKAELQNYTIFLDKETPINLATLQGICTVSRTLIRIENK
jgi:hypothetical protein